MPCVEVPAPRCTCTVPTAEMKSGVSYQKVACESGLFIGTPLAVTFSREASVPRMRIEVAPTPMPVSDVATSEGVIVSM